MGIGGFYVMFVYKYLFYRRGVRTEYSVYKERDGKLQKGKQNERELQHCVKEKEKR